MKNLMRLNALKLIVYSVLCLSFTSAAQADEGVLSEVLQKSAVYVRNGIGGCSGSFIKFAGMNEKSKVLVLTNGHCTSCYSQY